MGAKMNAYKILVGKPEGKGPLGRRRCKWADNIKMDLREIVCGGMDWINLARDRDQWRALVNRVMNLQVSQIAGNFSSRCTTGCFSRTAQFHEIS
jgi:hypothetical protein